VLKAAVIGVGSMGNHHTRVYQDMENVELVCVVDPNIETAQRVGSRYHIPYFTDTATMLATCRPDIVSLAAPTSLHYDIAAMLLRNGVHVLVEKPIASSVEDGERLVDLAAKYGLTLAVGHIERFNPAVMELACQLRRGALGCIYKIHTQRLSPYPGRIKDTGVVIDLASHDIDLIRFLMREPIVRLYSETLQTINSNREDMFNGLVRFQSGAVGILDVNWITPTKMRTLTITGARGMYICNLLSQELFLYANGDSSSDWDTLSVLHGVTEGNVTGFQIRRHEPLVAELADFVNAVESGTAPSVTGEDGLETLRLATEFVESGATQEIMWREAALAV